MTTKNPGTEGTDTKARRGDEVRHVIRIRRGADVEIRLWLREYQGRDRVHIRLWRGADDGDWLPSTKGVTVPLSLWPQFFEDGGDD